MEDKRVWVNLYCTQEISVQSKDSLYAYLLRNDQIHRNKNHYKTSRNHINVRFQSPGQALKFSHKTNWTTALKQCEFKESEIANMRVSFKK